MNILGDLKKFLENKFKKVKNLPEYQNMSANIIENDGRILRKELQDQRQSVPQRFEPISEIDNNIFQYMEVYYQRWLENMQSGNNISPYSVLVRLNGQIGEPGNNRIMEEKLLEIIKKTKENSLWIQTNSAGDADFYHVHHGQTNYKADEVIRLYVSTDRKNVAQLSYTFMQKMQNEPYYFKFMSDNLMSRSSRTEKLVFYTDDYRLDKIIHTLEKIKEEQPNLLEGSEKANPFMKKIKGFIGYAPDPKTSVYKDIKGKTKNIDLSYNTFLSESLKESMHDAMRSVVAHDPQLTIMTNGDIDFNSYMRIYPLIKQIYGKELVGKTKENLKILQKNNEVLDIKGLGEEIQEKRNR